MFLSCKFSEKFFHSSVSHDPMFFYIDEENAMTALSLSVHDFHRQRLKSMQDRGTLSFWYIALML